VYVSYNNLKAGKETSFIGVAKSGDFGNTWQLSWKDIIKNNRDSNVVSPNFKSGLDQ
jgi:hypothetical protein